MTFSGKKNRVDQPEKNNDDDDDKNPICKIKKNWPGDNQQKKQKTKK